jgi:hypothetical protein
VCYFYIDIELLIENIFLDKNPVTGLSNSKVRCRLSFKLDYEAQAASSKREMT